MFPYRWRAKGLLLVWGLVVSCVALRLYKTLSHRQQSERLLSGMST